MLPLDALAVLLPERVLGALLAAGLDVEAPDHILSTAFVVRRIYPVVASRLERAGEPDPEPAWSPECETGWTGTLQPLILFEVAEDISGYQGERPAQYSPLPLRRLCRQHIRSRLPLHVLLGLQQHFEGRLPEGVIDFLSYGAPLDAA